MTTGVSTVDITAEHDRGCWITSKRRFPTEHDALVALTDARIAAALRRKRKRRECRVYLCPHCQGWHLTSREAR